MSLSVIVGIGVVAFILVYFGTVIDKREHFALQLLAYSFAMILCVILAKGTIDSNTSCELVQNQTVEDLSVVNQSTTNFVYNTVCYSNTQNNSSVTFYRLTIAFFVLYLAYLIFYTLYYVFKRFEGVLRRR